MSKNHATSQFRPADTSVQEVINRKKNLPGPFLAKNHKKTRLTLTIIYRTRLIQDTRSQVTEETCNILQHFGFKFEQRGLVAVKGKGQLMTYYLVGKGLQPNQMPPPMMETLPEMEEEDTDEGLVVRQALLPRPNHNG